MHYDDFIQHVQEYADLDTREEAVRLTEVVLATLGERLYRTEQDTLRAQLPDGLKDALFVQQPLEHMRTDVPRYGLEEFYTRVGARAGLRYPAAVAHTKAVMHVLREAVSAGELAHVRTSLPAEFGELFEAAT